MASVTWSRLAGDTAKFACQFQFESDPDMGASASPDDGASWGSFQIWIEGLNLSAHNEQGEYVDSVHWYLLPLLEWIVDNWDPLLHEERAPVPEILSAVTGAKEWHVDSQIGWESWWRRHNLQAAREGGLYPNLFIRRWRDRIEFSWNNERIPGAPSGFAFLASEGTKRVDVEQVANPLAEVLGAAIAELQERVQSARVRKLALRFKALRSKTRSVQRSRLAWLSGFQGMSPRFRNAWAKLEASLSKAGSILAGIPEHSPYFIGGTPHAAVLFGCLSPQIRDQDVLAISQILLQSYTQAKRSGKHGVDELTSHVEVDEGLQPWDQGYLAAEEVLELVARPERVPVDIADILSKLEVVAGDIELSDANIRALSILGPHHKPTVFVNTGYKDGTFDWVRRFSLAHELAHLILDRDRGSRVSVASGPWAPLAIEQRANAFAAGLLMPENSIRASLPNRIESKDAWDTVERLAKKFHVSRLAVINHIYNLGYLQRDQRDNLRALAIVEAQKARLNPPSVSAVRLNQ